MLLGRHCVSAFINTLTLVPYTTAHCVALDSSEHALDGENGAKGGEVGWPSPSQ